MAIYEYQCTQCRGKTEVIQKYEDPAPDVCPHCQGRSPNEDQPIMVRLISSSSFQLEGGGWAKDLYGK